MTEAMQKFKEIVEKSKTIAVRFGNSNDHIKILSALTLHQALLLLGKKSNIDASAAPEEILSTAKEFFDASYDAQNKQEENILIRLNAKDIPVSELKYEKNADELKIILSGVDSKADIKNIQIEKEKVPVDLLLLIDPAETDLSKISSETPSKDTVKISSKERSLPQKIAEIIKALDPVAFERMKNPLFFLLKEELRTNIGAPKTLIETLLELSNFGIGESVLANARKHLLGTSFWKIFGRALARSHDDEDLSTFWTFLPKSDFEKVGADAGPKTALKILNEILCLNQQNKFFAFLWESGSRPNIAFVSPEQSVNVLISSRDHARLKNLASLMSTSTASPYFFANGFKSFSEAEVEIRKQIKKVL